MPTKSLVSIITSMILVIGIIFTSNLFLLSGNVVKAFTKLFPQAPANRVFNEQIQQTQLLANHYQTQQMVQLDQNRVLSLLNHLTLHYQTLRNSQTPHYQDN